MPAPPTDNLRVVKYAAGWGYSAAEWERALRAIDWTKPHAEGGPERLKIRALPDGSKDATVWRATLTLGPRSHEQRYEVVLKVEPLGSVRKKVQALLRRTRAFRQWRGTELLRRAHVMHAPCHAIVRARSPAGTCEVLAMSAVRGPSLLELLRDGVPPGRVNDLAHVLAMLFDRLEGAGITNPDAKPSNLIVTGVDTDEPGVVTVDADAVRKGRPAAHPLLPLVLEPMGTGLLPPPLVRARVLRAWVRERLLTALARRERRPPTPEEERRLFHEHWRRLETEAAAHGDPTPKHDPLARG